MIGHSKNNTSSLPTHIVYQPSCLTHMPPCVEINDVWGNGGSGIGQGSRAMATALGEYFERRHFYMEIIPDASGRLDESLTKKEAQKFYDAFAQTCRAGLKTTNSRKHRFNLTKVYRTSDFSCCYIPSALLSLGDHLIENDSQFYPLRDTCGCSFHRSPELAIFGSLKEQLERQFLIKFWLTKSCKKIFAQSEVFDALQKSTALLIYRSLIQSGEITIIDISDQAYPGLCVITVYGNSNKAMAVRYCAGMAYAATIEEALEKSILELWQTFRFMQTFAVTSNNIEEIHDSYLRYFISCNEYETYKNITTTTEKINTPRVQSTGFATETLIRALNANGFTGYLYAKPIIIEDATYYAAKYVSPDLFLHMNSSKHINFINSYSESFLKDVCPDRKNVMVPFP